jgi:cell wall-associated NlpC family hydrolase
MTWDYSSAYPGGPMVGPDLPHPSYPPDAAPGHTPTKNSPAHKAYKRGLCRGGRWGVWDPTKWDEVFSNAFSHGKTGGNVIDSGVAGFQRQMKIQPTGWVGKETYNAMRSARIPEGLPNAGQALFDSVCVDLLKQAGQNFAPQPTKTIRQLALAEAAKWLGTKESPFGSNKCKFTDWYGMVGPWCAMFATYCFETAAQNVGKDSPSFVRGVYYAYVPYILNDARAQMRGLSVTTSPVPGDLVLYDWNRNGVPDHVGIFENGSNVSWTAIEGNTSMSSNSNGGEVMRRKRSISNGVITFVRVAEPK